MSSPKLTLTSPISDFWDERERCPEDGPEITAGDCAYIVHEAAWRSVTAHPNKEAQRRWLLVARAMADMAIQKIDAEQAAKKENA